MSESSQAPTALEVVHVTDVILNDRIRKNLGDITALCRSIKEFGIIQPIVLTREADGRARLIAGGRRFTALTKLGVSELTHGKHFVWRGEEDSYTRKAVELEENLRRTDLSWHEVASAKKQLLTLMEAKYGPALGGRPSRADIAAGRTGFGVRKLADMLGESAATTSNDLQVAEMVEKFPALKSLPTKQDALRRLNVAATVVGMQVAAAAQQKLAPKSQGDSNATASSEPKAQRLWELHRGPFETNIHLVADSSVDLIATDLPYACGLGDSSAAHSAGLGGFVDSGLDIVAMCSLVARECFRILRDNRFAVLFFGAAYYVTLHNALSEAGLSVDPYWFIWSRNRTAPPSPARYAKCYDPALICSKGNPTLLRPNLGNVLEIASVSGADRLHAAQKPVEVMERFILDMTAEGSTVVDIMAGSGTTGVAAVRNKRRAVLFELEETNCKIIEGRMASLK